MGARASVNPGVTSSTHQSLNNTTTAIRPPRLTPLTFHPGPSDPHYSRVLAASVQSDRAGATTFDEKDTVGLASLRSPQHTLLRYVQQQRRNHEQQGSSEPVRSASPGSERGPSGTNPAQRRPVPSPTNHSIIEATSQSPVIPRRPVAGTVNATCVDGSPSISGNQPSLQNPANKGGKLLDSGQNAGEMEDEIKPLDPTLAAMTQSNRRGQGPGPSGRVEVNGNGNSSSNGSNNSGNNSGSGSGSGSGSANNSNTTSACSGGGVSDGGASPLAGSHFRFPRGPIPATPNGTSPSPTLSSLASTQHSRALELTCGLGPMKGLDWERFRTAIHMCQPDAVRAFLIHREADPNHQDDYGTTPLHWAADANNEIACRMLLEFRANPNIPRNDGIPPLYLAAHTGSLSVVSLLIAANADVNYTHPDTNSTVLHIAASFNRTLIVAKLLEARAIPTRMDIFRNTPLTAARVYAQVSTLIAEWIARRLVEEALSTSLTSGAVGTLPYPVSSSREGSPTSSVARPTFTFTPLTPSSSQIVAINMSSQQASPSSTSESRQASAKTFFSTAHVDPVPSNAPSQTKSHPSAMGGGVGTAPSSSHPAESKSSSRHASATHHVSTSHPKGSGTGQRYPYPWVSVENAAAIVMSFVLEPVRAGATPSAAHTTPISPSAMRNAQALGAITLSSRGGSSRTSSQNHSSYLLVNVNGKSSSRHKSGHQHNSPSSIGPGGHTTTSQASSPSAYSASSASSLASVTQSTLTQPSVSSSSHPTITSTIPSGSTNNSSSPSPDPRHHHHHHHHHQQQQHHQHQQQHAQIGADIAPPGLQILTIGDTPSIYNSTIRRHPDSDVEHDSKGEGYPAQYNDYLNHPHHIGGYGPDYTMPDDGRGLTIASMAEGHRMGQYTHMHHADGSARSSTGSHPSTSQSMYDSHGKQTTHMYHQGTHPPNSTHGLSTHTHRATHGHAMPSSHHPIHPQQIFSQPVNNYVTSPHPSHTTNLSHPAQSSRSMDVPQHDGHSSRPSPHRPTHIVTDHPTQHFSVPDVAPREGLLYANTGHSHTNNNNGSNNNGSSSSSSSSSNSNNSHTLTSHPNAGHGFTASNNLPRQHDVGRSSQLPTMHLNFGDVQEKLVNAAINSSTKATPLVSDYPSHHPSYHNPTYSNANEPPNTDRYSGSRSHPMATRSVPHHVYTPREPGPESRRQPNTRENGHLSGNNHSNGTTGRAIDPKGSSPTVEGDAWALPIAQINGDDVTNHRVGRSGNHGGSSDYTQPHYSEPAY